MFLRYFIVSLLVCAVAPPCVADVELVLADGQVVKGARVERDGGQYLLDIGNGTTMPIPVELVAEVRLLGEDPAEREAREEKEAEEEAERRARQMARTGIVKADPQDLGAVPPDGPSGIVADGPQQLAGDPVRPPRTSEQLEVFGEPSEFQQGVIDPNWRPKSAFETDHTQFNPSTFTKDIVDHDWQPESAFKDDRRLGVAEDHESTFQKGLSDPAWVPQDGFKKQGTSFDRGSLVPGRPGVRFAAMTVPTRFDSPLISLARLPPVELQPIGPDCAWCPRLRPRPPDQRGSPGPRRTSSTHAVASSRPPLSPTAPIPVVAGALAPIKTVAADRGPSLADCAEQLLTADGSLAFELRVRRKSAPALIRLPIVIYEARWGFAGQSYLATFTDSGGCRLLNGPPMLMIADGTPTDLPGLAAFNAALSAGPAVVPVSDFERVEYAFAVFELLSPEAVAQPEQRLALLRSIEELERLSKLCMADCRLGERKRRRVIKKISHEFQGPHIRSGVGLGAAIFFTWSSRDGQVRRVEAQLARDGQLEIDSELIADRVGV